MKNIFGLCITVFLLLFIVEMCYAKSSTILVSTYGFPTSYHNDIAKHLAEYIYNCSVASSYTTYNWFGSSTTEENIYNAVNGAGYGSSVSFYVGHGDSGVVNVGIFREWHSWITDNSGDNVFDFNIYPHSDCENLKFAFLWSCHQGEKIGGTHPYPSGIPFGMPYAWLHTNDLSQDGYIGGYGDGAFIGFDGYGPLLWVELAGYKKAGYHFAGWFYQYAMISGISINKALDFAARRMWDVDYEDCVLRTGYTLVLADGEVVEGKMVVYGDGNLEIGSAISTPALPRRFLSILVESPVTTIPEAGTHVYFDGTVVTVTAEPQYFSHWTLDNMVHYENPITVTMDSDHILDAHSTSAGCPTLFVWDGTEYAEEGFLDIHAEDDITVQHEIQTTLVLENCVYKLQLRELDNYTSHIDQVKLYAVDYEGEWHLCPLIYAEHNDSYVTWELLFDDENRIDLTPTQTVNLKFLRLFPYSETAYFMFEINGYNMKGGGPPPKPE